jgi:nucleoside-diphosphate-sugar epimerase
LVVFFDPFFLDGICDCGLGGFGSFLVDENHPIQGQSPYSASKIGADQLVNSFFTSFNLPVMTLRPFNTYGPRQSARAIIPTIITQLLEGKEEILDEANSIIAGFPEVLTEVVCSHPREFIGENIF